MVEEKKNGSVRWKLTVGEALTILVIITGFVTNYAIRGAELRALSRRVDGLDNAIAAESTRLEHHQDDRSVHFMVDSPAMSKLDEVCKQMNDLKGEIIKLQTILLRESKSRQP